MTERHPIVRRIFAALAVLAALAAVSLPATPHAQPASGDDRVILVTLDGARTEEIFGGLDAEVLRSTLREGQALEAHPTYKRFWAPTPEERRQKLLPFFWGTLMTRHGSIAGHRPSGSVVSLANTHRFSYPGYAELLLGEAHDEAIKSNDPIRNPFPTVLEVIRDRLSLQPARVAAFTSWGVFNAICEHTEGAITVNAGLEALDSKDPAVQALSAAQFEALPAWNDVRLDAFTFRLAMAHLAAARPRAVYLAFDETDDWSHDGRYDRLLESYARTDRYLSELWSWLESQPDYRGRTHLLITTDHGRGHTPQDWKSHGAKVTGAEKVWIAFASPRMAQRGVWGAHPPLTTSQVAATLAAWVGIDWQAIRPKAGAPIK
jgi:hypothetical protein